MPSGYNRDGLRILREGSPTSWFADWLLSEPPADIEVTHPPQTRNGVPHIRIEGTVVKYAGNIYVLTGHKWMHYWEGKWPD